jgi:phage head maturation protease
MERGDVTQCSFSFRTRDDDENTVRLLLKVDIDNGDSRRRLFPAYPVLTYWFARSRSRLTKSSSAANRTSES